MRLSCLIGSQFMKKSKNNDLSLWGLSEHEVVKNLKKINSKYFLHINMGAIIVSG